MADIRMFRAIRPVPEKAARIAALPYDVYNRKEAAEIVKKNQDSFLAIDRAETSFDEILMMIGYTYGRRNCLMSELRRGIL